jgi:hypothetical protein
MFCVHRWRSVQFEAETAFKLELKNNGVVRRSSQESDVSVVFPLVSVFRHTKFLVNGFSYLVYL